jgi:hypothetical protein
MIVQLVLVLTYSAFKAALVVFIVPPTGGAPEDDMLQSKFVKISDLNCQSSFLELHGQNFYTSSAKVH